MERLAMSKGPKMNPASKVCLERIKIRLFSYNLGGRLGLVLQTVYIIQLKII